MKDRGKHYYAFISYKSEDREVAKRFHEFIEGFNFSQLKVENRNELPQYARPIFLDDEEINGGVLKNVLIDSLDSSDWLILLCSRKSSGSKYVNDEVQHFIDSGKLSHIIPYIIDGTPKSSKPEEECFPEALLNLPENEELVAFNPDKYSGGQTEAIVRIIEHMFGFEEHELWNRHLIREEEERKKLKNATDRLFRVSAMAAINKAMPLLEIGDNLLAAKIAFNLLTAKYDENPLFIPEAELFLRSSIFSSFYNQSLPLINFRHNTNESHFYTVFSGDSKYLFYSTSEETGLIDLESLKKIHFFEFSGIFIDSAVFSHKNSSIVILAGSTLYYYDISCNRELFKNVGWDGPSSFLIRAFFSEDDTYLIVLWSAGLLYYDLESLDEIKSIAFDIFEQYVDNCFVSNNRVYISTSCISEKGKVINPETLCMNINSGRIVWRYESSMIKFSDSCEKLVYLGEDGYHVVDLKTDRVVIFDKEFCDEFNVSLSDRGNLVVHSIGSGRTYIQWFDTEAISFIDAECEVFLSNVSDDCIIRFINQNNNNNYRFVRKPLDFFCEITPNSGITVGEPDECYRLITFTSCGNPVFISNNCLCSVYDADTGESQRNIDNVKNITFSPDGRYLVTEGEEYNLKLYESEYSIKNLYPESLSASNVVNSKFGKITCEDIYEDIYEDEDQDQHIHKVKFAVLKNELTQQKYVFHYEGSRLCTISSRNQQYIAFRDIQGISILDISSFSIFPCVRNIAINQNFYYQVKFSEDNEWLLVNYLSYLDVFDKNGFVTKIKASWDLNFRSVSAYNGVIAISDREKTLILRWSNGNLLRLSHLNISTSTLILIPNEENLILIDDGQILNYITGEIRILDKHPKSIYEIDYTFDLNRNLIAGLIRYSDNVVVLVVWNMLSGYITFRQELVTLNEHNNFYTDFRFDNDGIIVGNLFVPYPSLVDLLTGIEENPYSFEMTESEKEDYYIAF